MSRYKPSTQAMVEARGDSREDVVQVEDSVIIRITRISKIQIIQVVAEAKELFDEGGAFAEEVDGSNRDKTAIKMWFARSVERLVIMQMRVIAGLTVIAKDMVVDSKGTMHRHQTETVVIVSLLCST